jgi:hypothetical protein
MVEQAGSSSDVRFDANETAFLERELTQLRAKLYEVQYADNVAMTFVPLATDIAPDAKTYSTPVLDRTGRAKIIGNGVTDIPRVDLKKDEILGQVYTVADSYGFELMELRNAARLNLPIEMWKAQNARASIDDEIDQVLAFGQTHDQAFSLNVTGLANNPAVAVDTTSFTPWTGATPAATQLAALNKPAALLNATLQNKSTLLPNLMVMPSSMYDIAATTPVGNTSDLSVLEWFKRNNPYIKDVRQWNKLATANAAGTGPRILVYRMAPLVLEGVVPLLFEQLPPQAQGLELITNCIARVGGVKLYHPEAVSYCDPT